MNTCILLHDLDARQFESTGTLGTRALVLARVFNLFGLARVTHVIIIKFVRGNRHARFRLHVAIIFATGELAWAFGNTCAVVLLDLVARIIPTGLIGTRALVLARVVNLIGHARVTHTIITFVRGNRHARFQIHVAIVFATGVVVAWAFVNTFAFQLDLVASIIPTGLLGTRALVLARAAQAHALPALQIRIRRVAVVDSSPLLAILLPFGALNVALLSALAWTKWDTFCVW
jgi:uncharacterized membrane protein YciS (DUF1049 family)